MARGKHGNGGAQQGGCEEFKAGDEDEEGRRGIGVCVCVVDVGEEEHGCPYYGGLEKAVGDGEDVQEDQWLGGETVVGH